MRTRHQAVLSLALLYVLVLCGLAMVGPLRVAGAYLRDLIQGSGRVIRQNRPVTAFHAVQVTGIGELEAVQGTDHSLVVEAEDNLGPLFECEVRDGCLRIRLEQDARIRPTRPVRFLVSAKKLDRIELTGAATARLSALRGDSLDVSVVGASKAEITEIDVRELSTKAAGASTVRVTGQTDRQTVSLTGASRFQGGELRSGTAVVNTGGASAATVRVENTLTASARGASSISYRGNPKVTATTSGPSRISGE
ncbi:MAG: head GIN domain-containing protein [Capsulimonadales bacterium]|nr:head GIN domain-containing protein [Capsulimonadales bacterium]